jgi:uncharacterized membrane protein (Fun14 family)
MIHEPWLIAVVAGLLGLLTGYLLRTISQVLVVLFLVFLTVELLATFQVLWVSWDVWSKLTLVLSLILPEVKEFFVSLLQRAPHLTSVAFFAGFATSVLIRRA